LAPTWKVIVAVPVRSAMPLKVVSLPMLAI